MTWLKATTVALLALLTVGLLSAAAPEKPAAPAAAPGKWFLSPVIVKEVKEVKAFLHGSAPATLTTIGQAIDKAFTPVTDKLKAKELFPEGSPMFVYSGMTDAMDKEFTLETGVPVAADAKPTGDLKLKSLPAFRAATAYYTGPLHTMPEAAHKFYEEVGKAGLQPEGGYREVYLFWEGPESPNNVVELQVGVAK